MPSRPHSSPRPAPTPLSPTPPSVPTSSNASPAFTVSVCPWTLPVPSSSSPPPPPLSSPATPSSSTAAGPPANSLPRSSSRLYFASRGTHGGLSLCFGGTATLDCAPSTSAFHRAPIGGLV